MKPRTPEAVFDALMSPGWHHSIAFYKGSLDCRRLPAPLIRSFAAILRARSRLPREMRVLLELVSTGPNTDEAVQQRWRDGIEALRLLFGTSPTGTARERGLLMQLARNQSVVAAMRIAARESPGVDPNWVAVLFAEGSPESKEIANKEAAEFETLPKLFKAVRSYEEASAIASPQASRSDLSAALEAISRGRFTWSVFWRIVDAVSVAIDPTRDLADVLEQLPARRAAAFGRYFVWAMERAYTYEVWGAAYLALGGCSDDAFEAFRAELVLCGSVVFTEVLRDPDSLADHRDVEGDESILSIVLEACGDSAGRTRARGAKRSEAGMASPTGTRFDFDDTKEMLRRYPRLATQLAEKHRD